MCSQCYSIHSPVQPVEEAKPAQPAITTAECNEPARCACCNRKLGVMPLSCKCGKMLCKLHHLPEEHECSVNYRELGTKQLKDKLQQLRPKKIGDIN
jgi:predicted nucleic acid binding AN1-type Zn finger protein